MILTPSKKLFPKNSCYFCGTNSQSGIIRAENPFLEGLRKLANEKDCLLIFDEVQSGIGEQEL